MIKALFPRFPLTEEELEEMLEAKREDYFKQTFHEENYDEEVLAFWQAFEQKYPKHRLYVSWRGCVNGIRWFYDANSLYESEYLEDSKEWKEYLELKHQLIYIQKIPYDSPEWQAVIEKYKRKGDVSYQVF